MAFKLISKDQYQALYKEALFILKKICHDKTNYLDIEELAHLAVELFAMKITKNIFFTLEIAAQEALTKHKTFRPSKQKRTSDNITVNEYSQYEAQRDLDNIYVLAEKTLTFFEKQLFCKLLSDLSLEQISIDMNIDILDLEQIQESLMGKLHHAATSSSKSSKRRKGRRHYFIGKIRSWITQIN